MISQQLTQTEHRHLALDALTKIASLIPTTMDAALRIGAGDHLVQVRLVTENPTAGQDLADLLYLAYEDPNATDKFVHHLWSGRFAGCQVRIAVLVPVRHFQTGSSTVRCGLAMREAGHTSGWDLGNITVDASAVTCPLCFPRGRS